MLRLVAKIVGGTLCFIKRFFPVRYSLALAVVPAGFVYLALWPLPHLLGGLLVLEGPVQLFNVTWISFLFATMVLVTYRVTQLNAATRFSDYAELRIRRAPANGNADADETAAADQGEVAEEARVKDQDEGPDQDEIAGTGDAADKGRAAGRTAATGTAEAPPWRLRWLFYVAIGLPIPLGAVYATAHDAGPTWSFFQQVATDDGRVVAVAIAALAVGILVSIVQLALLTGIQQLLLPPDIRSPGLLPFEAWKTPERIKTIPLWWFHRRRASREDAREDVWPGYTRLSADGKTVRLEPGHAQLALCAAVLLGGYAVSYWCGFARGWFPSEMSAFPALFFALLAILVIACILPGAAFFLDYYRIPAPVAFLLLAAVLYWVPVNRAEHFYDLNPPGTRERAVQAVTLDTALGMRALPADRDGRRTLVVVSASGGGIQASAWTAQVLTGLHERYGTPFSRSIGLISSVSGGSVGTMYYVAYRADLEATDPVPQNVLDDDAIRSIRAASRSSALEATAWGVAYPDLIRKLVPVFSQPHIDRGWAVEQAWRASLPRAGDDLRLTDLAAPAAQRGFPVVVFNATLVETGQRLLISPVVAGTRPGTPRFAAPVELMALYPESHLPLTTAVRLSATFPYVSPIARPAPGKLAPAGTRYHVADGGYSDNDGLVTAIDWLDRIMSLQQASGTRWFDRVVLVRIQPFPVNAAPRGPASTRGWMFSTIGPLQAMANVRVASQTERGHLEVSLFEGSHGNLDPHVDIVPVSFVFAAPDGDARPPLSWKMTPGQKRMIDDAWQSLLEDAGNDGSPINTLDTVFAKRTDGGAVAAAGQSSAGSRTARESASR